MIFQDYFDAVIMLTWSDWKTEPRSNRYHYATRFARTVPVLFLQHHYLKRSQITVEPSGIDNIDIVNVSIGLNDSEITDFKQLMDARGIRRPLVWIYDSMNYQPLLDAMPTAFRVYHATEDYLTKSDGWGGGWSSGMELVAKSVVRILDQIDFMVACTEGVATTYLTLGNYRGQYAVVENGCDAEYFLEYAQQYDQSGAASQPPIAIFQGGINSRLDYSFMHNLIQRMPTWEFRFCGKAVESEGWSSILQLPNVKYYGALPPEGFARLMCDSTVGIITYIQDQWIRNSLPLKAYEYVACGLPVVTIPIAALERDPDLMTIATTPEEFEIALRTVAKTRFDPVLLQKRRESALAKSYNGRFSAMCKQLLAARMVTNAPGKKLKLAMLYDKKSMRVNTIQQHLNAFQKYSNHEVTYVPATSFWNLPPERTRELVDFSYFDLVVLHYSVRLSVKEHLDEGLARALENFNGFKVLFIQDEYEGTEIARQWMDRLRFDLVYTCVPDAGREHVYPSYRFPATEFLPTLTGYVPDESGIGQYAQPLAKRKLLIAYRGRKLPTIYGSLGYEKYQIGAEMKKIAAEAESGIASDIEVDDSKRIYGAAWYQFLGSARATLGTESGANVFDFDGSLKVAIAKLEARKPDISFEEIANKLLIPHEKHVRMNQISPKIFEAICLRTALVLFEGTYSDVIVPDLHFIALKKDFSNAREVIHKLQDIELVQQLTDRAYADIIGSGKFSYQSFIEAFDTDIATRVLHGNRCRQLPAPLFFEASDGSLRQALPAMPTGLYEEAHHFPPTLADFYGVSYIAAAGQGLVLNSKLAENNVAQMSASNSNQAEPRDMHSLKYRTLQWAWRLLPLSMRVKLFQTIKDMMRLAQSASRPKSRLFRLARKGWRLLPVGVRVRFVRLLERVKQKSGGQPCAD